MRIIGFIGFVAILLVSCSKDSLNSVPSEGIENIPITFNVNGIEAPSAPSRSLVNLTAQLEHACTPVGQNYESTNPSYKPSSTNGLGKSIGLWSDRTDDKGNLYSNIFENVEIIYDKTKQGNPYNNWNYKGAVQKWEVGTYKFRAYYPKEISIVSSSSASSFVVEYNTNTMQEDLLIAYNQVNTHSFDLYSPVPLRFKHALAALRFQIKFKDGFIENDRLTSFWLENTTSAKFSHVGMMVYGISDDPVDQETIVWRESYQAPVHTKVYYWENNGIDFSNTTTSSKVAVAYTNPATSTTGKQFAQNDGWIMIIPQHSDGTLSINFTTEKGGSTVYSVAIPKITRTDKQGVNAEGEYFIPGYCYSYTYSLTKTDADLDLSIAPWNELNSSFEIPMK